MTVSVEQMVLYAAAPTDFSIALGSAAIAGIPLAQVTGNFATAWSQVADGQHLVIAVGGAAVNALYYNPCGWANPAKQPGGHTPFSLLSRPALSLPGKNFFVNAAGVSAIDTLRLAVAFTYVAVHGQFPAYFSQYPPAISPTERCVGNSTQSCPCASEQSIKGLPSSPTPLPLQSTPYWGVDSAAAVTTPFLNCVVQHYGVPQVWGRYINQVSGVCDGLSGEEVALLHGHGVRVLPIYNGFASAIGSIAGQQAAVDAVQLAKALGIPGGTPIFADIEVNYSVDAPWILAWVQQVNDAGYKAGMYGNPINGLFSAAYCQALNQHVSLSDQVLIWSNEWEPGVSLRSAAPVWNPAKPHCDSAVVAWQYGENGVICPQGIDTDLILPSLYQQLW